MSGAFNARAFLLEYANGMEKDHAPMLLWIKIINKLRPQQTYGTPCMISVTKKLNKVSV